VRRWGGTAAVAAVLTLATLALVRPLLHEAPHPGGDNAAYVALGWSLVSGQGYTELWDPAARPHAKYPPVFPALLALRIAGGGVTWGALKAVTAATALLLVLATFLWARRRAGLAVGAGVAALTALSPGILDYGRWVLSDVPFTAFTLLALWAADRASGEGSDADADAVPAASSIWPAALALAGLAYFTRTAGLPLVLALVAALALQRRWRTLAVGGAALAGAGGLWFLRTLGAGPGVPGEDYVGALWLLDPYDPGQGLAGPAALVGRVVGNGMGYLTLHLPVGMVGSAEGAARALAVLVVAAGIVGWALRLRRRPGPAELFVPLYVGLILIWPEVWSGDRFALPLIPLAFLYAAEAAREGLRRIAPAGVAGGSVALAALVLFFQAGAYTELARESAACRGIVRVAGPHACFGAPVHEFAEAARWARANLPADAAVLTRKPRIWYVLSGLPSRTYPFEDRSDALLTSAEAARARYAVLDFIGSQGMRFLAPAIAGRSEAFCVVAGFGGGEGRPGTQLLGIRGAPAAAEGGNAPPEGTTTLGVCPPDFTREVARESRPYSASSPIPIFDPAS
jgi:hypothetical protein